VGAAGAVAGLATWALWPLPTLAVLPFVNVAQDETVDYLCLGLAESLITRIKHLPVAVKSMSLVANFAGSKADPRDIGRQVRAQQVVTGSVALQDGRLIVTAELIDIASGASLWNGRYERDRADIFTLWDEVATAIVDDGLHLRLTREERRELLSRPTDNVEAFTAFLRARPLQMGTTEADYLDARGLLQLAVDRDPRFAEAWVALAGTYWTSALDSYEPPSDAWPQVDRCLTQAAAIQPGLADLHFGRAVAAFFGAFDWTTADLAWQRGWAAPDRDLQPELLVPYAFARWALGDARGALRIVRRARAIDPISPIFLLDEASYLLRTNEPAEAAARCLSVIQTHPEMADPYFRLAEIRRAQQRFDEAIDARRRAHALKGDADEELDDVLTSAAGPNGYARVEATAVRRIELRTLERRVRRGYASPLDFARAYAQLGERDEAIDYLNQALSAKSPGLVFLNVDRAWDLLRADPAFKAAVKQVGLPSAAQ
jgi:TolB-like protein